MWCQGRWRLDLRNVGNYASYPRRRLIFMVTALRFSDITKFDFFTLVKIHIVVYYVRTLCCNLHGGSRRFEGTHCIFLHIDFKPEDGSVFSSETLKFTYQTTTLYYNPEGYDVNYLIWFYVSEFFIILISEI
jgi:hypothetical protein